MISIRSDVLVAVNRPPGCGSISAIWLSGLAGSGLGLLGLTEATSNAALGETAAVGAAWACANAVVAVSIGASSVTRAKVHIERMLVMSTFCDVCLTLETSFWCGRTARTNPSRGDYGA